MDTWIWIVIAVVVALLLLAVVAIGARKSKEAGRRRRHEQELRDREKATVLRDEARDAAVTAQKTEAGAAVARADADEARLEAERLERHAVDLENEAAEVQGAADDRLAEADRLDPDVANDRETGRRTGEPVVADQQRGTSTDVPAHETTTGTPAAGEHVADRPQDADPLADPVLRPDERRNVPPTS